MMAAESNSKKPVKFLPYDLPYMTDELKKRAKLELFEDEDTRVHSLKLLRSMLKDEKNLNFMDDEKFLLTFLRARKFDVKRAATLIKAFYTVKQKHDELYDEIDINVLKRTLSDNSIGFFPYRDSEGCCILLLKIENWNLHKNNLGDCMRLLTAALLHAIESPSTQVAGIKVIVDFKGFSLRTVPYMQPKYLFLITEALQNCFPMRFRAIHMINENQFCGFIWQILRQFLTKKLTDRFHFHGKNVKKLHKYFSPSILPVEYEGELPAFDNSEWADKLLQYFDQIKIMTSFGWEKQQKRKNS